jgi:putative FmdB family regulatory protein
VPLYDFRCRRCGERFEALVAVDARPPCPACGAADPERLLGSFAGPFTVGVRGAAARRSNAQRKAREDQRQEGFARQREERRQRGAE